MTSIIVIALTVIGLIALAIGVIWFIIKNIGGE